MDFKMDPHHAYRILPLGDSAITVDFGNTIDEAVNKKIIAWFHRLQAHPLPGMTEAVPAYSSLTLYYDSLLVSKNIFPPTETYEWIKEQLEKILSEPTEPEAGTGRLTRIPVCYDKEFAPDIESLAASRNIPVDEVVAIHASCPYRVYMLGFLPGFPYMGPVDERIRMPRKPQPLAVAAGSVGIAGNQTGIYPVSSPGGWSIIGRTPLRVFDPGKEAPVLLQAGDHVQFYSISRDEFNDY
jgi:inhibitor of KinA